jgi:prepilin-type N-terminal cleavage/methylation domain-containing protein
MKTNHTKGFTLVELSIVMVVIALVAGGVLVGRDLIAASQLRATMKQIETYNTAFNAFFLKYNCLPGDCGNASEFGFIDETVTISDARPTPGIGDYLNPISSAHAGDGGGGAIPAGPGMGMALLGEILPWEETYSPGFGYVAAPLQTILVPVDGLEDGKFSTIEWLGGNLTLDQAHLHPRGNSISSALKIALDVTSPLNNEYAFLLLSYVEPVQESLVQVAGNYFTITATAIPGNAATATLTGTQAYNLDSKLDDGLPLTGGVLATGSTVMPEDFLPVGMTFDVNADSGPNRCINNNEYNLTLGSDRDVLSLCTTVLKSSI